ncbi:hypothetical protein [Streptomyces fagopyri]|uniref:hypothetical protein n=1 Tax=Streptomyces fagopyri TaxID=2662397 RepID=UPI0033C811AF
MFLPVAQLHQCGTVVGVDGPAMRSLHSPTITGCLQDVGELGDSKRAASVDGSVGTQSRQ